MENKWIFILFITLLISCSNDEIKLNKSLLKQGQQISYIANSETNLKLSNSDISEKITTNIKYRITFKNIGHIQLSIDVLDFQYILNDEITKMDISDIEPMSSISDFLTNDNKKIILDFHELNSGELDIKHINYILNKRIDNEKFPLNIIDSIVLSVTKNWLDYPLKTITNNQSFKISNNNNNDPITFTMRVKDNNSDQIKFRGSASHSLSHIKSFDHNLNGTIVVEQTKDKLNGYVIESKFITKYHGLIMNSNLDNPLVLNMDEIYDLRIE